MGNSYLQVKKIKKSFGNVLAFNNITFNVEKGEFFTLLGPSGCGKTTLLRCIAGFLTPEEGQISVDDVDISRVPPHNRDIGFVFQRYALFPTMTVFKNVAFGLEMRKITKEKIKTRVEGSLKKVGLQGFEQRKIRQLSGGQQQRVALARAMAINPRLLLLDEPLSNLDAKLRIEMRTELRRIQQELKITAIYVTHDQEEAFAISDRILIMNDGIIQQIGTMSDIYYFPNNKFVADFIGKSNFISLRVVAQKDNFIICKFNNKEIIIPRTEATNGKETIDISIRPEHMIVNPINQEGLNILDGKLYETQFLGSIVRYFVDINGVIVQVEQHGITQKYLKQIIPKGEKVYLGFFPENCTILNYE
jgi:ABC-type Fe3+/spermidine/putrescine transport system ATPase subunit